MKRTQNLMYAVAIGTSLMTQAAWALPCPNPINSADITGDHNANTLLVNETIHIGQIRIGGTVYEIEKLAFEGGDAPNFQLGQSINLNHILTIPKVSESATECKYSKYWYHQGVHRVTLDITLVRK